MEESIMDQKEKSRVIFCELRRLGRLIIYAKIFRREFFQKQYSDKIKKADSYALEPVDEHY